MEKIPQRLKKIPKTCLKVMSKHIIWFRQPITRIMKPQMFDYHAGLLSNSIKNFNLNFIPEPCKWRKRKWEVINNLIFNNCELNSYLTALLALSLQERNIKRNRCREQITFVVVDAEGPAPIACWAKPCLWISICNSGAFFVIIKTRVNNQVKEKVV